MNSSIAAVTLIIGVGSGLSSAMKVACHGSGLTVIPHRRSSTDLLIRRSEQAVQDRPCAGPIFQSCPHGTGVVQRLGSSRGGRGIDPGYLFPPGNCAVTARTVQGMARVRSGQAPAWPLSSDRSVRRGSRVKRDFACTFTRHFSCLVTLRSQSCLGWRGGHVLSAGHPRTLARPGLLHLSRLRRGPCGHHRARGPGPPGKRGLGCPQAGPRRAARYARAG